MEKIINDLVNSIRAAIKSHETQSGKSMPFNMANNYTIANNNDIKINRNNIIDLFNDSGMEIDTLESMLNTTIDEYVVVYIDGERIDYMVKILPCTEIICELYDTTLKAKTVWTGWGLKLINKDNTIDSPIVLFNDMKLSFVDEIAQTIPKLISMTLTREFPDSEIKINAALDDLESKSKSIKYELEEMIFVALCDISNITYDEVNNWINNKLSNNDTVNIIIGICVSLHNAGIIDDKQKLEILSHLPDNISKANDFIIPIIIKEYIKNR